MHLIRNRRFTRLSVLSMILVVAPVALPTPAGQNFWASKGPSPSSFGGWAFGNVSGRISALDADWGAGILYVGTASVASRTSGSESCAVRTAARAGSCETARVR